jgi:rhodanese-related sulfurtransferase
VLPSGLKKNFQELNIKFKSNIMKPLRLLAVFLVPMGLIIAAVPQNKTKQNRLNADDLVNELASGSQYMEPETIADMLVAKDPSFRLIDVRSQDDFEKYSLTGAVNIPLPELLSEQNAGILSDEVKTNVFYSNGSSDANEAWMLARQLGYENCYVLRGGLNYWFEAILNPPKPSSLNADDEIARYDFRVSASQALGGGNAVQAASPESDKQAPAAKPKPASKKKKAAGGC